MLCSDGVELQMASGQAGNSALSTTLNVDPGKETKCKRSRGRAFFKILSQYHFTYAYSTWKKCPYKQIHYFTWRLIITLTSCIFKELSLQWVLLHSVLIFITTLLNLMHFHHQFEFYSQLDIVHVFWEWIWFSAIGYFHCLQRLAVIIIFIIIIISNFKAAQLLNDSWLLTNKRETIYFNIKREPCQHVW